MDSIYGKINNQGRDSSPLAHAMATNTVQQRTAQRVAEGDDKKVNFTMGSDKALNCPSGVGSPRVSANLIASLGMKQKSKSPQRNFKLLAKQSFEK